MISIGLGASAQCSLNQNNIYSFSLGSTNYEIIKEKESWVNAAACAVNRGGHLAEINSKLEQDSIYYHLTQASISMNNTRAPDGGNAAYVWIGGNDKATEGRWEWDGDNIGSKIHFYQGARNGNSINGLYNNWGNEPDNFNNNQDALAMALSAWPFGSAGQWNDINDQNSIYYVIEIPNNSTGLIENNKDLYQLYPNPIKDEIKINSTRRNSFQNTIRIIDSKGALIFESPIQSSIDVSDWKNGNYIFQIHDENTVIFQEFIIIQH